MPEAPPTLSAPPPLTRRVTVSDVPPEGILLEIVANAAERDLLAQLNELPEVFSFRAVFRVRRWRGDGLEAEGEIHARLRQTCVVTLDEFDTEINEPVEVRFAPRKEETPVSRRRRDEPPALDLGETDEPDPLVGGAVDLGAVASEFFTLALDPYPRKLGAEFSEPAPETEGVVSPFAALRNKRGMSEPD